MAIERPTIDAAALDESALAMLARLHCACLPGSLLTRLGDAFVARFYGWVQRSPAESLFLVRGDDSRIVGCCLVSHEPSSLARRMSGPAKLALAAIRRPQAWPALLRQAMGGAAAFRGGDIVLLFAAPDCRRRGVATAAIAAAEAEARARGAKAMGVLTQARADNAALGFYARQGYTAEPTPLRLHGEAYVRLAKPLDTIRQQPCAE